MEASTADLVAELKLLRKGRGIAGARLAERAGPALRAACRIGQDQDTEELRHRLSGQLGELAGRLPRDLRTAVLAAFGLHQDAQYPFYQDRVRWLARALGRDDRTARRRVDEGIERLAQLAVAIRPVASGQRWHTEELRVAIALDRALPETFMLRRIVSDVDGLSEVELPPAPGDVDLFHGGDLAGEVLRLPGSLDRGERHDVALRFRAELPRSRYVCVPGQPCDRFDLYLRFGAERPHEVGLIEDVATADEAEPARRMPLGRAGEVHVRYRDLVPGFGYGVSWTP